MGKHPRILVPPTQLQNFIKISRIGFPGNLVKIFISWDSASLTESENLFGLRKIITGKNFASRNSAYPYMICKKSRVLENNMLSTIIPLNDIIWTFDDWIQHNIWFSLMITSFQIEIAFMMLRYHIQNLKYYRGLNKICNMNYII